jgi:hypothetical protein
MVPAGGVWSHGARPMELAVVCVWAVDYVGLVRFLSVTLSSLTRVSLISRYDWVSSACTILSAAPGKSRWSAVRAERTFAWRAQILDFENVVVPSVVCNVSRLSHWLVGWVW